MTYTIQSEKIVDIRVGDKDRDVGVVYLTHEKWPGDIEKTGVDGVSRVQDSRT